MAANPNYIKTDTSKRVFQKADKLIITPYDDAGDKLLETSIDIHAIVADTTTLEQDDPSKETIEGEFTDSPLDENNTLGAWNFSATCIDFQNPIVKNLYGCSVSDDGVVVFPKAYKKLYCMIHLVFKGATPDVVLPKVLMASKATLANMKTGVSEGIISGTCQSHPVKIFKTNEDVDTYLRTPDTDNSVELNGSKSPDTPVAYVPRGYRVLVKTSTGFESEQLEENPGA